MNLLYILLLIAFVGALLYLWQAAVVSRKNQVLEALAGINVQLQKRHDLIPNILQIAQRFLEQEQQLITEVTQLRVQAITLSKANNNEQAQQLFAVEQQLSAGMGKIIMSAENYPKLKSDNTMMQAMQTYSEVEENISAARRFYNSAISELRSSIQIFPGTLFKASAGEAKDMPFFDTTAENKAPVDASDFLKPYKS